MHVNFNVLHLSPGFILSAFFIGYILTQVPGGWLAQRFSAKYVYGIGILATAVFTLLTPLAASLGIWVLVAVRVLEGIFEVMCVCLCPIVVLHLAMHQLKLQLLIVNAHQLFIVM